MTEAGEQPAKPGRSLTGFYVAVGVVLALLGLGIVLYSSQGGRAYFLYLEISHGDQAKIPNRTEKLAECGDRGKTFLLRLLEKGKTEWARGCAAEALGAFKDDDEVISSLKSAIIRECRTSAPVRCGASASLARMGGIKVEIVAKELCQHPDRIVQEEGAAIQKALGSRAAGAGDRPGPVQRTPPKARPKFTKAEALRLFQEEARQHARKESDEPPGALLQMRTLEIGPEAVPVLIELLRDGPEHSLAVYDSVLAIDYEYGSNQYAELLVCDGLDSQTREHAAARSVLSRGRKVVEGLDAIVADRARKQATRELATGLAARIVKWMSEDKDLGEDYVWAKARLVRQGSKESATVPAVVPLTPKR